MEPGGQWNGLPKAVLMSVRSEHSENLGCCLIRGGIYFESAVNILVLCSLISRMPESHNKWVQMSHSLHYYT